MAISKEVLEAYKSRCEVLSYENGVQQCALAASNLREKGLRDALEKIVTGQGLMCLDIARKALKAETEPPPDTEENLKEFARRVIRTECWNLFEDLDGCDVQEWAEKLGLIVPHIATKEDVDDEFGDFEVGDPIFKFSELLETDHD